MFTGLVEEVGMIRRLERREDGGRLTVQAHEVLQGTKVGDSIAVSGACLTVVELGSGSFVVDCMPETLARTTLGNLRSGALVNLERSLGVGSRLGGHFVLGHVDAVAEILAMRTAGEARELTISLPEALRGYVASKGSVALDGISLTVMSVGTDSFEVGVIPHTSDQTTLRNVGPGRQVNLEADVLARYVIEALRALGMSPVPDRSARVGGLTEDMLREQGFA